MKLIKTKTLRSNALIAAALFSTTGASFADSKVMINRSGKEYRQELQRYKQEVRFLDSFCRPELALPTKNSESPQETRQMPSLPNKSVQYSQLLKHSTLTDISIFHDDSLVMKTPKLSALITIQQNLNPFSMDSQCSQSVDLRQLLELAVSNNLDIRISRSDAKAVKNDYLSSLGQFLPDITLSDSQYWFNGNIKLPINAKPALINLTGPFTIANASFNYHVYRGGKIFFGALQSKHLFNASNARVHASYSDILTDIARRYYQLVLEESILQIRIRAADTSEEQLRVSTKRFEIGYGTNLDVLQARQQLAADRQSLLDQQVTRRQAAIDLAAVLNYDMSSDLKPFGNVNRALLVRKESKVENLLQIALRNRPELKDLLEQKKAASSQIAIAAAPLQPTVDFVGSAYGIGPNGKVDDLYFLALNMNWKLGGLGTVDSANIAAAKNRAFTAKLQVQKKVVEILQTVRGAYIKSLATDQNITESDIRVSAALEEIRLATIRYDTGVGTHLDVLTAQRDYTQAQISKAQAITDFNIAQVQLVRELGLISIDHLIADKPVL